MAIMVIASFLSFFVLFTPSVEEIARIEKTDRTHQVGSNPHYYEGHDKLNRIKS